MEEQDFKESKTISFKCPSCGNIKRDDVLFLCNKCNQEDMIYKDGVYMCPSCLNPGKNFECMKCGSKDVEMKVKE